MPKQADPCPSPTARAWGHIPVTHHSGDDVRTARGRDGRKAGSRGACVTVLSVGSRHPSAEGEEVSLGALVMHMPPCSTVRRTAPPCLCPFLSLSHCVLFKHSSSLPCCDRRYVAHASSYAPYSDSTQRNRDRLLFQSTPSFMLTPSVCTCCVNIQYPSDFGYGSAARHR